MRPKSLVVYASILVGLLLVPAMAEARWVHQFTCTDCHKSGAQLVSLGNSICLSCHNDAMATPPGGTFLLTDNTVSNPVTEGFSDGDASNAMGTNPAPGAQTSHNWGAPKDVVPAAGAKAPTDRRFYGRYGYSTGKVTCSRCHDPHADNLANPQLLRLGVGSSDAMCLDCHASRNKTDAHAPGTHPIVADYATVAAAKPSKFKPIADLADMPGDMALLPGNKISCTTCHGVHFTDSDSATADGYTTAGTGDGKLLKANGSGRTGATSEETAQLRSELCQACHVYKTHGSSTKIGCLDCHGGHSYDPANPTLPNYYILKPSIGAYKTADAIWLNEGGSGFCQNTDCHPGLTSPHNGLAEGGAAQCSECHNHANSDVSFGGACNSCHGYPPIADTASGKFGYAVQPNAPAGFVNGYKYLDDGTTLRDVYKNEVNTPHAAHAAGGTNYSFPCKDCHFNTYPVSLATHANQNFQDVSFDALAKTGGMIPGYNGTPGGGNDGICANVYCHSNGGPRGAAPQVAIIPAWENGSVAGAINTCDACHGNTSATMTTKANSAVHGKHLTKYGNNCAICHSLTAASNVALATGAIGGDHVDGQADVSFNIGFNLGAATLGGGSYGDTNGTCVVYCHSNGKADPDLNPGGYASADWDSTPGTTCGICHQATSTSDSGPVLGGSHAKHVFDADGPQLACDACHTNDGSSSGTISDHINGAVSLKANFQTAVCNDCHAVDSGETVPTWGNAGTVDCNTCHSGTTQSSFTNRNSDTFNAATTANTKTSFLTSGHGLASGQYPVTGKNAAAKVCTSCHDKTAAGHFDADDTDLRLTGDYSDKNAFCANCHGTTIKTHQTTKQCIACHDPHGTPNIAMIYRSQTLQNAKDTSGTGEFSGDVVFTAFTGADSFDEADSGAGANADDICATCHSSANGISHNNREVTGFHNSGDKRGTNCTLCHQHPQAFLPVGNSCADCHGNAPATGAHGVHFTKDGDTSAEDRSDCALCHTGAHQYTYNPGADQNGGLNHGDPDGRKTLLATSVGYDSTDKDCTTACHQSVAAGDGVWDDANGLNCDSCHYYAAVPNANDPDPISRLNAISNLGGRHNIHFNVATDQIVCADCHGTLDAQGPGPLTHKHAKALDTDGNSVIDDADWLKTQGKDYLNPGGADINVDDSALNAGAGNSWISADSTCSTRMCHDPSGAGKTANWGLANSQGCEFCHNYSSAPATGSHSPHMSISATYGKSNSCANCHPSVGADVAHRTGSVEFNAGMGYTGTPSNYTDVGGSCGTQSCHNDGKGAAPVVSVTWGTAQAATCALCHAQTPTTGAHNTHLAATAYGPNPSGTTACNQCHAANDNNSSMAGRNTHMSGGINFNDGRSITAGTINANTTVASCDNCHGGLTAANATGGAKKSWSAATRLACGTCHGDYTLANSKADNSGVTAPSNAGTAYSSYGHGKGGVAKACADCHNNSVAHISGALNDADRLKDISGVNYGSNPNGYCEVCHNTATFDPNTHYTNAQTTGGTSDDGNRCNICHNPHGASGLDAMVRSSIAGKTVAGFTDSAARSSYFLDPPNSGANAGKYGICQVCHDPAEVSYFSRTTASDAGHNPGSVCISCHKHEHTETAFKASCNGCHGSSATGQYWPSGSGGSIPTANDQVGRHQKHVEVLADRLYSQNIAELLADPATGTKQKAICAYCHATPGTDGDHGLVGSLPADKAFHPIWDVVATDSGYGYSAGNCTNVDCHNNKDTGTGTYGWHDAGTTACAMCHAADVTTTGTHNEHLKTGSIYFNNGRIGCTDCHASGTSATTPPSTGHLSGAMNATDYNAVAKTCATNDCHNDGKGSTPAITPTWGVANSADCNFCHTNSGEGHNGHFAAYNTILIADGIPNCTACHTHDGPNAAHFDSTVSLLAAMGYTSGRVTVGDGLYGTCTTSVCHTNGAGAQVETPAWNSTGAACVLCHGVSTNGVPNTGSHTKHVEGDPVISSYTAQGLTPTATEYKFNCTACHGSTLANHIDNGVDVVVANWTQVPAGGDTCGQNSCHQDGKNNTPARTATWGSTASVGTDCKGCHGNSPATGAHDVHGVGIHTADTYTGTTGLLASGNTEPSAHGVAATSTVIGCNTCHNTTTDVWYNAANSVCSSCHSDTDNVATGNESAVITNKANHVNGSPTIAFQNIQLKTKAQIRDDITTVPELNNTWSRVSSYKAANQYDQAKASLTGITVTGTKTCQNVACHNGIETQAWTTTPASRVGCMACHTQLP